MHTRTHVHGAGNARLAYPRAHKHSVGLNTRAGRDRVAVVEVSWARGLRRRRKRIRYTGLAHRVCSYRRRGTPVDVGRQGSERDSVVHRLCDTISCEWGPRWSGAHYLSCREPTSYFMSRAVNQTLTDSEGRAIWSSRIL